MISVGGAPRLSNLYRGSAGKEKNDQFIANEMTNLRNSPSNAYNAARLEELKKKTKTQTQTTLIWPMLIILKI
jgi:hypothetical protein